MIATYTAAPDVEVLTTDFPIPGFGFVPINSFVLKGSEPILVDTGAGVLSEAFLPALREVIDPSELRWLWITHTDFDHIGCLHQLLAENPKLRVITTFLGVGIMSLSAPLPMDRVLLLNPGEKFTAGERTLHAFRPPAFDNPSTTGFYEENSESLFSSDCFGALLQSVPQDAADIAEKDLRDGQLFWATVDSPWLHKADQAALGRELDVIRRMAPKTILSSHLPAAPGRMTETLLAALASACTAPAFVGPNQAALEQMLAGMTGDA